MTVNLLRTLGLDGSVTTLPGVGPAVARRLARLGPRTVAELLEHFPRAHQDRRRVTPLAAVEPGCPVVVEAEVAAHRQFGPRGRFLRLELAAVAPPPAAAAGAGGVPTQAGSVPAATAPAQTGPASAEAEAMLPESRAESAGGGASSAEAGAVPAAAGAMPQEPGAAPAQAGAMPAVRQAEAGPAPRVALLCFGRRYLAWTAPVGSRVTVAATFERRGATLEASIFELRQRPDPASFDCIIPIYPLTEGVRPAALRKIMLAACARLEGLATIWDRHCLRRGLLPVALAVRALHFPADYEQLRRARTAVAYAELLQLQVGLRRRQGRRRPRPRPRRFTGSLGAQVAGRLPFTLTADQTAAVQEIERGLRTDTPGARLLQGDVGSGKTLVALLAAAAVVEAGEQAALIVPTELLAHQHFATAELVLAACGVRVGLLTGAATAASRGELLAALRRGEVDLLLGTHALLQADVRFHRLGLVIVDEQHRFGVAQRRYLVQNNPAADLLLMTATPIPRSLALTVYGDLELATIRELPPGRLPVRTHLARLDRLEKVYAHVQAELAAGGQAYFVAPRITPTGDTDPALPAAADATTTPPPDAESLHAALSAVVYPQYAVGMVHGGMDEQRKHATLTAFRSGELRVLVATTVVEVGVDVAGATCMVVLGAERFGLATLHQLRGRVGRGPRQAYAFLVYDPTLPPTGIARLRALKESGDGFVIAEHDLMQRGPGELLGLRQAGLPELRVADLSRDFELARLARCDAAAAVAGTADQSGDAGAASTATTGTAAEGDAAAAAAGPSGAATETAGDTCGAAAAGTAAK